MPAAPVIRQLNHLALAVTDVGASERFYRDALGLPSLARPAFPFPGAWFRIGTDQELHLIAGQPADAAGDHSRGNHFALAVEDIQAAAEHLTRMGIAFRGPKPRPDGVAQLFLADPDGHLIELCQLR